MPNVSGLALLSLDRTITSLNNLTPIPGLAITLFNIFTNIGASILTDNNGKYEFINVEPGTYLLMETYGVSNTFSSPFDFSKAASMKLPDTSDPNISLITKLPQGTNKIDSLNPNTILLVVDYVDIINQNFVDGPVIYTPILALDFISTGPNLVTSANNGNFGLNYIGTYPNTSPENNPYPDIAPSFGYQQYSNHTPNDGYISMVNIQTLSTFNNEWWNLTNHSTGDEVGNFLIVNGDNIGQSIFTETINVSPSTYYTFFTWIANQVKVLGKIDPQFTIQVVGNLGSFSQVIFKETSSVIPTNTIVPEWKQVGAIFSSEKFETITVDIISEGGAAEGNDYAIDDISLQTVLIDVNIIDASKSVLNKNNQASNHATIGDTLVYTVSISNTSSTYNLTEVNIVDTISNDLTYIENSIIGGTLVSTPNKNPMIISVGTVPKDSSASISFEVMVNQNASIPVIVNQAEVGGKINIDPNLLPTPVSIVTNKVNTYLDIATLDIKKSVSPQVSSFNEQVTYSIDLYNEGTVSTNNILLTDMIPSGMEFVLSSVYINNQNMPNITPKNNILSFTLPNINFDDNINISFNAIVASTILDSVINTATVNYNYLSSGQVSPTLTVTSSTVLKIIQNPSYNVVLNQVSSHDYISICNNNTYTITIYNNGSNNLYNVIFYDNLPCELEYIQNSLHVNYQKYNIKHFNEGVSLGTIPSNSKTVVEFRAKAICMGTNPVVNNQACITYNISNNTISTCSNISMITIVSANTNYAHLSLNSVVCPETIGIGGVITYGLGIYNDGTGCAENIIFNDILPSQLSYQPGSLYINYNNVEPVTVINNTLSVTLPCICPKTYLSIEFDAFVSSIYSGNIVNTATVSYNFVDGCKYSNTLSVSDSVGINLVPVADYNISLSESVLRSSMKLYSSNTFTVTISNNSLNDLNDVIFYNDTGCELIYKPYSFTIDNEQYNVQRLDEGVYIGTIPSNALAVIKFKVKLVNIGQNPIINNQSCMTYTTNNIINLSTICSNICPISINILNCK